MQSVKDMEVFHRKRKKRLTIRSLQLLLWEILLFLMIFMPRNIQEIKAAILVALTYLIIIEILSSRKKMDLNKNTVKIIFIFLGYALLASMIGFFRLNPGASGFFRINVLYYILFTLLITAIRDIESFMRILRVILLGSNAISIYTILLLLVNIGVWPESLFIVFDVTSNVGLHSGYTQLVNTNLSMMIFIAPFVTILFGENYSNDYLPRRLIVISEILIVIAVILSGRRVLWIAIMLAVLGLLFKRNSKVTLNNLGTAGGGVLLLISVLWVFSYYSLVSLNGLTDRFISVFQGAEGDIRMSQAMALWQGFLQYPLFGSGAGIGVIGSVRNVDTWMYELSYNLILYNSGIIGSILYFASLFMILSYLWKLYKRGRYKQISAALTIAYISVLIGNATNPYFSSSFDFLWFIFIPLMYINITEKDNGNLKQS